MSLKPFQYDDGYSYSEGWDRFALRYAELLQPGTVYTLTKELMHGVVNKYFQPETSSVHVLDVNCGTGNDLPFFLKKGWRVTGIDGSAGMLNLAAKKYAAALHSGQLTLHQALLETWRVEDFGDLRFDLIYSVTGGFSYINDEELRRINKILAQLLKPTGKLIVANLNSFCLFESLFFAAKGRIKEAFRRRNGTIKTALGGTEMTMYLRNPADLRSIYAESFRYDATVPLLAFTPPYQSGYRAGRVGLGIHRSLETMAAKFSATSLFADQVISICSHPQVK